jgi:hypothetical protein
MLNVTPYPGFAIDCNRPAYLTKWRPINCADHTHFFTAEVILNGQWAVEDIATECFVECRECHMPIQVTYIYPEYDEDYERAFMDAKDTLTIEPRHQNEYFGKLNCDYHCHMHAHGMGCTYHFLPDGGFAITAQDVIPF